ncbi:peptide ABC transporter substrate-binding protein [Nibricoccus sp. IMCC34717]|uniref:peptide ABC transporter substrate-binding protein n=1 Tax=Nibricoccus sp. IMCC34717 TaxID=3034021 RepID=UPI0038503F0C
MPLHPLFPRLLAAACLALLVSSCGKKSEPESPAGPTQRILVKGNATEPESLDPHLVRGQVEWTIVGGLFEGLVTPDPMTLEPRPGVAERWEVSPDATTFTFHLRSNANWSDGTRVTAQDFVFSAWRMLSPKLGSAQPEDSLFFLRGGRAFQKGETADFATVGIQALDTQTLVLQTARPTPFLLSALYQFYPVKKDALTRHGAPDDRTNPWAQPGKLVGNGAFWLEEWAHGQRIILRKRADYWDAANVALDGVEFRPIENAQQEENAFRTGQLHVTFTVPFSKLETYQQMQNTPLRQVDDRGVYFYTVNVGKAPFNDKRVRQALSLAIDREQLTRVMLRGAGTPALHFTPPQLGGYTASPALAYDPARAKALLAEAGFPGGKGLPPIEILFDSREYHRIIAEVVQQMWRQNLGVQAVLRNHETQVVITSKNQMDFDVARGWWNAVTFQDPYYFLGAWKTGALYNEARWSNAEFDAAIEATWTGDAEARLAAFRRAEAVFLEELPAIPIFFSRPAILVSPRVKGLPLAPFGDRRLKSMRLE